MDYKVFWSDTAILLFVSTFTIALSSCEMDRDSDRNSFLVLGDIDNCYYTVIQRAIADDEAIQLGVAIASEFKFSINSVFEECDLQDPEGISDCWPTIYDEYFLFSDTEAELAVDSDGYPLMLEEGDRISAANEWLNSDQFLLRRRASSNSTDAGNWALDTYAYLGLRTVRELDTFYMCIELKLMTDSLYFHDYAEMK